MTETVTITQEQINSYIQYVEETLIKRSRNGTLLSTFDLISGAMIFFFHFGLADKMPAKWVFAPMREGLLPDGLNDQVQRLQLRMKDFTSRLEDVHDLVEAMEEDLAAMQVGTTSVKEVEKRLLNENA